MASRKIIVFGPTGAVGSAAARTAAELGAKVVLAMRDTSKSIPELSAEQEKEGTFERVQADLTKPDTVRDAVTKTGAKHAFIYVTFGAPDHMIATIEALKSAGIELVVFLSSFSVQGDLKAIEPSEIIPYAHAQVEINLSEAYGPDSYVAVRPGSFASNTRDFKTGLNEGEVKILRPELKADHIVPEDIGRVSGTILAKGPQDEKREIYLLGPQLLTQEDTVKTMAKVLGKDVKIISASEDDAYRMFTGARGIPPPLAKYLVSKTVTAVDGPGHIFGLKVNEEDLRNVEKYSGKKATSFQEWVEKNKGMFVS